MPSSEYPVSNRQNVLLFFHIPSDTGLRKSFETRDIHLHFMFQLVTQGHGHLPVLCSITGAESSIETDDILRLSGLLFFWRKHLWGFGTSPCWWLRIWETSSTWLGFFHQNKAGRICIQDSWVVEPIPIEEFLSLFHTFGGQENTSKGYRPSD